MKRLTVVLGVVIGGLVVTSPDVDARVIQGGRACFEVAGAAGDIAVVNLTPVQALGPGNGLLTSSNTDDPTAASNVNFDTGTVDPNVALAPIGDNNRVCFHNSDHNSVELVADHLTTIGANRYTPARAEGTPKRVADTRDGDRLQPGARTCFTVAGNPSDTAVVNLTPVDATGPGNGLLTSSNITNPPAASNVNYNTGTFDPNIALAPIGDNNRVCFHNSNHHPVHLIADHLGTINAGAYANARRTGAPKRVADTRDGDRLQPGARTCFAVAGNPGDTAVVNLTPVDATGPGNGLLTSSNITNPPAASNVNYNTGTFDPNIALAPIGDNNRVCFHNSNHHPVHLIADHLGTINAGANTPARPNGTPKRVTDTRPRLVFSGPSLASLGEERYAIVVCRPWYSDDQPVTVERRGAAGMARWAQNNVAPWFDHTSSGRYRMRFDVHPRASEFAEMNFDDCTAQLGTKPPPTGFDHVIVSDGAMEGNGGGRASSGFGEISGAEPQAWMHETGHMQDWPHSFIPSDGEYGDGYNDPLEVMSGQPNWIGDEGEPPICRWTETVGGNTSYSSNWCWAQGTSAFNRLAAGWIDQGQVYAHTGGTATYHLSAPTEPGTQMVAATASGRVGAMLTIEARPTTGRDRYNPVAGVAVYRIDQGTRAQREVGLSRCQAVGVDPVNPDDYNDPQARFDHVLQVGSTTTIHGVTVKVVGQSGSGYSVEVSGSYQPGGAPDACPPLDKRWW